MAPNQYGILLIMADRAYGHDGTDDFETLAEAERQEDGTVMFRTVLIDKRPGHSRNREARGF